MDNIKSLVTPINIAIIAVALIITGSLFFKSRTSIEITTNSQNEVENVTNSSTTNQTNSLIKSTSTTKTTTSAPVSKTPVISNTKDTHGCDTSNGYLWCDVKNKCLRPWEEKCGIVSTTKVDTYSNIQNQLLTTADSYGKNHDCSSDAYFAYKAISNIDKYKSNTYILYCQKQKVDFDVQLAKYNQLVSSAPNKISSLIYKLAIANLYSNLEIYSQALPVANSILSSITAQMLNDQTVYSVDNYAWDVTNKTWSVSVVKITFSELKQKIERFIKGVYTFSPSGVDGDYL